MARPLLHTCPPAVCPAGPLSARWIAAVCQSDAAPFAPRSAVTACARSENNGSGSAATAITSPAHGSVDSQADLPALWYDTCTPRLQFPCRCKCTAYRYVERSAQSVERDWLSTWTARAIDFQRHAAVTGF
ncbi:hypothetical protein SNOG_04485 [Parastagonospora nodorum SN15]|uniref:Uncharacterized protein n=1 Tax=Phaeosphaeria nodorum (strain SN15 / ATCC MYA-4574 / FGSC 10173) TaxID=321614 RepID=Q0UUS9_PHANO|nr:hypothetical protein SNOG_04485 [Parastagonospora nodorum SN15]EAT88245.1 hypothetical protein SNOG_04485 [Parastagonospora nodorum SN15]